MTQRPNDPPWAAAPPEVELSLHERMAIQIERAQPRGAEFLDSLSDEDLGELAMAAAIEAELKEQDAVAEVPGVLPLRRPARPARVLNPRWAALAAVLAGVALIPFAWRGTQGGAVRVPSHAVAMLENQSAGLPEGWDNSRPWSNTRGGEVTTDTGLAVRTGAYMVDIDLAVRAGDAETTRLLAQRVAINLAEANTAGTMAARPFNELAARAGAPAAELLPLVKEAAGAAADAVDGNLYALGAWAEAARLAANRRDAAFFREGRSRRTLDRAKELVGNNAEAQIAITAIGASLEPNTPRWPELRKAIEDLLAAIG